MASEKTIERLSLYRRLLEERLDQGLSHLFSHDLATLSGSPPACVRRDIMATGFSGSPARGYDVAALIARIEEFLDAPALQPVVLVGVGNLGRALLSHFTARRPNLAIVAAFDRDPERTGRVVHGCRCYSMQDLEKVVAKERADVGVIAVPAAEAQSIAEQLVRAGVKGILNFARTPLRLPSHVYVENIDLTMSLEKVAFFARQKGADSTGS